VTAEHPSETLDEAVRHLRAVIIAGESYRLVVAQVTGMGVTETQALSYLAVYGERGQNELATDLGITSGAATALLDRLERRGVAERRNHPRDRRRVVVALTEAGRAVLEMSHKTLAEAFASVPSGELLAVSEGLGRIAADLRVASKRLLTSSEHGLGEDQPSR
jgi:DNA-binding MarR family transcriptional regulator